MSEHDLNYSWLEGVTKGFANRGRLQILELLAREAELSVDTISQRLRMGYLNASDHLRKMAIARLIAKRANGNSVSHTLTARGKSVLEFCKKLK